MFIFDIIQISFILIRDIICPLCENKDNTLAFHIDHYQLRTCNVCELSFIYPYLQKEEGRNPLSLKKQLDGERRSVNIYFNYIANYYRGVQSYLDIGCGCGELLNKAREFSIPLRNGIEEDEQRAEFAAAYSDCEVFDSEFLKLNEKKTYDLISLINVFSHIPDLNVFFENLLEILNEKGRVIIKTGLFKRGFIKRNFFDWQVPEHVHFIGDKTINYIANRYDFKCIENIRIPLAEELLSKDFLLSPGLSSFRNWLKKVIHYTPGACFVLRKVYTWYTQNKLYSNIIVLQKS